jgi:hypothetical protein
MNNGVQCYEGVLFCTEAAVAILLPVSLLCRL